MWVFLFPLWGWPQFPAVPTCLQCVHRAGGVAAGTAGHRACLQLKGVLLVGCQSTQGMAAHVSWQLIKRWRIVFLKGTPSKGASLSKSTENVQIFPFAVSYGCSINVYAANHLNMSILGCRHVGSPFTHFDQKKVER